MLDGFNALSADPTYQTVMAWVVSLLVVNAIARIVMFFINREIIGNLVLTAIGMTTVVAAGALFSRLPNAYAFDPVLYFQPVARLIAYLIALVLAVAGWAMTFKLIKIELNETKGVTK